jgi:hypothetical protein
MDVDVNMDINVNINADVDYSQWQWKVVIPSYNRANYIKKATLALCLYYKIPVSLIYIFIVDDDIQRQMYQQSLSDPVYSGLHIIYGPIGLKDMRNYISNYFEENTPLLCIDDDVLALYELYEDDNIDSSKAGHWKLKEMTPQQFIIWTTSTYTIMKNNNKNLFGIYPVKNGFFMKDLPEITYDARFCVGTLWGVFNKKTSDMLLTLEEKEDMERSILFTLKDGGVIRFNKITLSTKYYKTAGGMQTHMTTKDRIINSIESSKILYERYPTLCKLYHGKKMVCVNFVLKQSKIKKTNYNNNEQL